MGRPFPPGVSGNPGGKPNLTPDEQRAVGLAKEKSYRAVEVLIEIMESGASSDKARIVAACAILDRGLGKPRQVVDVQATLDTGDPYQRLASALDRIAERVRSTGVDPKPQPS